MPRQYIFQFDSTEVQGPGSWVKVRTITRGEFKQMKRDIADAEGDEERSDQMDDQFFIDHVFDWNWSDDTGNPIPIPKQAQDPVEAARAITQQESVFLMNCITGQETGDKKK